METLSSLPSTKVKTYLARLADAIGAIKLSKDAITEEYEEARRLALATGEVQFTGDHWEVTIAEVEASRLNTEKLNRFLTKHKHSLADFYTTSTSSRLTVKAIS